MKLKPFLKQNRLSVSDFAALCECHRGHIHRILKGTCRPGAALVRKIENVTEGKVTRYDLLENDQEALKKV